MQTLGKTIFSIGMAIAGMFGYHQTPLQVGATFTPVGTTQFTLAGSGITSTASTIQLTSFLLPDRVTKITMSMFGSIGYGVLEPQTNNIEDITFTGVTQNSNGTAALTGVSRGLSFYSPYQASTTLAHSHAGGSYFIISNTAGFYGQQFAFTNNPSFISSPWYFTDPPTFYNSATSTNQAASVAYVNSVAFGTALIPKGFGGTGVTGFPIGSFVYDDGLGTTLKATSSPTFGWITATSSTQSYFNGPVKINGSTLLVGALTASSTNNVLASSTMYTLNVGDINATSTIKINGVSLGGGVSVLYINSINSATSGSGVNLLSYTLPANTLTSSKKIRMSYELGTNGPSQSSCSFNLVLGNGNASTTVATVDALSGSAPWVSHADTQIIATSTAGMYGFTMAYGINNGQPLGGNWVLASGDQSSVWATYPTTQQNYIAITGTQGGGSGTCNLFNMSIELLSQ